MDFEEQLEKAEKLPEPSLVGSSIRSADDSAHNNYIHPEKYKKSSKPKKSSKKSIAASLDDLINEGALLGSEEDFERFLDEEGHVKDDAKYVQEATKKSPLSNSSTKSPIGDISLQEFLEKNPGFSPEKETLEEFLKNRDNIQDSPIKLESTPALDPIPSRIDPKSFSSVASTTPVTPTASSFYKQEDYSTPNLSEYQLENQIKDHKDLLTSIQSYDPHVLPKDANSPFRKSPEERKQTSFSTPSRHDPAESGAWDSASHGEDTQPHLEGLISARDSIHAPYFHTERSRSRSRSANPAADRSRSRSAIKPHLARGDSYKNTNIDEPTKYELPPDLAAVTKFKEEEDEDDGDDRRTRQSKPTMGESIAKAEAKAEAEAVATEGHVPKVIEDSDDQFKRDPSLVTTGDYTNFNVDSPANEFRASDNLYATRSISSTNYLRSISRSRSRARPNHIDASHENEKNDSNPQELVREGALVTDDPYTTIDHLDTMVEEVLHPTEVKEKAEKESSSDDVIENETEKQISSQLEDLNIKKNILPEDKFEGAGHTISANDISVSKETLPSPEDEQTLNEPVVDEVKKEDLQDLAIEKINDDEHEPKGPTINAEDIKVDEAPEETKDDSSVVDATEEPEPTLVEKAKNVLGDAESTLAKTLHLDSEKKPEDKEVKDTEDAVEVKEEDSEGHKNIKEGALFGTAIAAATAAVASITGEKEPETEKETEAKKEEESSEPSKELNSEPTEVEEKVVAVEVPESSPAVAAPTTAPEEDEEFDVSPEELRKHLEAQPIYLFTSLAGGMQIMPRTNRLATILQANGIKFEYRDLGTDEEAKKLWKRHSGGKPIPGVVRGDDFIGNFQDIEDANEEYRLREILYETL